ncbi:class I adenylate-forming enzyme family protein [Sphingopyxis kveilinensis]|uniref:class I adenylate-forming enzyme family protein n=1 Tax=Sphingopyxis kveilinensis TaxID=3114367 RepID=UPI0030CCBA3E
MLAWLKATVAERADRPGVFYFDAVISWADLDDMSDALAAWMTDRGVAFGDRIAIVLQNVPGFAIAVFAAWKLGAIPVPSNPLYRGPELARIFSDCTPKIVLGDPAQFAHIRSGLDEAAADAEIVLTAAEDYRGDTLPSGEGYQSLTDILDANRSRKVELAELSEDDLGLIMYTSGTTGTPRGAMIRHRSIVSNALMYRNLTSVTADSRILAAAPLFHITGYVCHLGAAVVSGASLILPFRMQADVILPIIRQHRPTNITAAITAYNALMNAPGVTAEDFRSFDAVTTGGAPVPPALHAEVNDRLGVSLHIGYGMTETTAPTVFTPFGVPIPADGDRGVLSIGIPIPGVEILICDDDGNILPPGAEGELWMRGPQIMAGYWRREAETAAVLTDDGWLKSGDIAIMNADGWIFLVDRKKDVIIASGFKVWPTEVEDVLYSHPAVREAAVIGVPDAYRGETVKAVVSLKPGATATEDELRDFCRDRLTGYKQPRMFEILDDLPKTVTGKIHKVALREAHSPPTAARI